MTRAAKTGLFQFQRIGKWRIAERCASFVRAGQNPDCVCVRL